ncbi:MAG: ATP synthase F1 subunit epsilon [Candidatus Buchananbacteria bacterium]|nr:ATP synthase F1 subunit epsilon [Candidatus Buchananbacteria bacterium]
MSTNTLHFKIVTPEKIVYESDAKQVTVPTESGEITVLPNHIALVSVLMPGELVVVDSQPVYMAVSGGFIEVANNQITILADTAERAEEIDEKKAQEAHRRAQQLLTEARNKTDVDFSALSAKLEKELARLKVARRKKYRQ